MAEALKNAGYAVSVVTPKIYRKSPRVENDGGINVFRFPFWAGDKLLIEHEKIPYARMVLYFITGCLTTAYVVLKHRCNLIHAHWAIPTGLIGVWVGMLLRKPLVVTVHGSDFGMATTRGPLLRRAFLYVCKRASHLTCVSENMRQAMEQMGIRDKEIDVFPMGVEEAFFEVGQRREQGSNDEAPVILSNRNLLPLYNVLHLIRAIPRVLKDEPQAKFLIAGEGQERESLERETERLGVLSSVQFLGRVPHEEMPGLLARADIYVSTSLSDGTSVSLLEAMASGALPVVTDIPANREWVKDGENGFLVPVGDNSFLAKKIVEALRSGSLRASWRKRNREMASERADSISQAKRILGIYEACCS
jgi:glycosyltransferase involved in cell wall biosynthesis